MSQKKLGRHNSTEFEVEGWGTDWQRPCEMVWIPEVLDPMVLSSKVREVCDCTNQPCGPIQMPGDILSLFDEELVLSGEARRLFVTLGQFSIIRLERDVQLVVPVIDYSLPTKDCCEELRCCAEDPCQVFSRIPFPEGQFAPRGCDCPNAQEGYTTT